MTRIGHWDHCGTAIVAAGVRRERRRAAPVRQQRDMLSDPGSKRRYAPVNVDMLSDSGSKR